MNDYVLGLATYHGDLVAVGAFTQAGDSSANYIARWDGAGWSPLGSGTNDWVLALVPLNDALLVGGFFTQGGDKASSYIARWIEDGPSGVPDSDPAAGQGEYCGIPASPNPFIDRTSIHFTLRESGPVSAAVYDILGRRIATLVDQPQCVGVHEVLWAGRDDAGRELPAGVYFTHVTTAQGTTTGRVVLAR